MKIGVLSLQGDFAEHLSAIEKNGKTAIQVRTIAELKQCDFLIMPGGESTTIGKLLKTTCLDIEIQNRFRAGDLKIWGTCAGAILCASEVVTDNPVNQLGLADYTIVRNAYGNQLDSFEVSLEVANIKTDCAFIRAPQITRLGEGFEVLASYKDNVIFAKKGNLIVSTCHPELYKNQEFYGCLLEGQFFGNFSNL
jgi:5'-phosphate synthase pdxT subunit